MIEYFKSQRVVFEDDIKPAIIKVEDDTITDILDYNAKIKAKDYGHHLIIPGLFDSHTHGLAGYSFTGTLKVEDLKEVSKYYASQGVMMFHATSSLKAYETIYQASLNNASLASSIMGIHAEGPFLNNKRFGAAKPDIEFIKPNLDILKEMIEQSHHFLKVMTLAYEIEGNEVIADYLKASGIKVALGHSEIDAKEFKANLDKIDVVTHLCNAMRGIHHREMGLVGGALLSHCPCELICDGKHVAKEMLEIIFKLKDLNELIMISDSTALSYLKPGNYPLKTGTINVSDDGLLLNEFGHIAGSSRSILYGLKYLATNFDIPLYQLVKMASLNPAKLYGYHNLGKIAKTYKAHLVILDDDFKVIESYKDGKLVYDQSTKLKINPRLEALIQDPEFMNFYI